MALSSEITVQTKEDSHRQFVASMGDNPLTSTRSTVGQGQGGIILHTRRFDELEHLAYVIVINSKRSCFSLCWNSIRVGRVDTCQNIHLLSLITRGHFERNADSFKSVLLLTDD